MYFLGHISSLIRDGFVCGAQVILDDITSRKQGEDSLRESSHKLRLLTGLTRHDIFNQLSSVELFQNLTMQTQDLDKIHEYLALEQKASELIERTIGFTQEYENFGIESCGWQQIYLIVESAINEFALPHITIKNEIPEKLEIYADPIIRKVFTTFIENAIRHGGSITNINFSCSLSERLLVIIYEYDGVGVPPEEKKHIFDHRYGKHTGIGLFLAREILSITGLSIKECGKLGSGAHFEICVPEGKYRFTT